MSQSHRNLGWPSKEGETHDLIKFSLFVIVTEDMIRLVFTLPSHHLKSSISFVDSVHANVLAMPLCENRDTDFNTTESVVNDRLVILVSLLTW